MNKKKRRNITLIEIIIVITLIGMIMAALAINYAGALDKGRAFRTETTINRLEAILNIAIAENDALKSDLESRWKEVVKSSPLVDDPDKMVRDGWGDEFAVTYEDGVVIIRSENLEQYGNENP